jgi:hypothetical protein
MLTQYWITDIITWRFPSSRGFPVHTYVVEHPHSIISTGVPDQRRYLPIAIKSYSNQFYSNIKDLGWFQISNSARRFEIDEATMALLDSDDISKTKWQYTWVNGVYVPDKILWSSTPLTSTISITSTISTCGFTSQESWAEEENEDFDWK